MSTAEENESETQGSGEKAGTAVKKPAGLDAAYADLLRHVFVETLMERDRTFVAIAAGGIGVIVTILTTVGPMSIVGGVVLLAAAISFAMVIHLGTEVFRLNADLARKILKGEPEENVSSDLKGLDKSIKMWFRRGIFLALLAGGMAGWTVYTQKETGVSKEEKDQAKGAHSESSEPGSSDASIQKSGAVRQDREGSDGKVQKEPAPRPVTESDHRGYSDSCVRKSLDGIQDLGGKQGKEEAKEGDKGSGDKKDSSGGE